MPFLTHVVSGDITHPAHDFAAPLCSACCTCVLVLSVLEAVNSPTLGDGVVKQKQDMRHANALAETVVRGLSGVVCSAVEGVRSSVHVRSYKHKFFFMWTQS